MVKKYWSHKTAEIQKGAKIGKGTRIWHNSQILKGAQIGKNCVIGHNCFVGSKAKIGNGVKIESNTDVWDYVILEDYVFVGPSAVFTNDINPRAKYPKSKFPQYGKWLSTLVKKGATIGANSTIICGKPRRIIGKWAMVGAGAVVLEDVPDYAVVVGNPAEQIGWICECGQRLLPFKMVDIVFEGEETICLACQRRYLKNLDYIWQNSATLQNKMNQ